MANHPPQVTAKCPIRTTLELLGGKWKLLLIYQLANGPLRFSALKRRIPDISEKMLIQELRILVDGHLVERHDYRELPPRVDYRLTEMGQAVLPLIQSMREFGLRYTQESMEQVEKD